MQRDVRYGMALQSPFPFLDRSNTTQVHLFVEALGQNRSDWQPQAGGCLQFCLEFNGIGENWWLAGGFLMPLNAPLRRDSKIWQITCSWNSDEKLQVLLTANIKAEGSFCPAVPQPGQQYNPREMDRSPGRRTQSSRPYGSVCLP